MPNIFESSESLMDENNLKVLGVVLFQCVPTRMIRIRNYLRTDYNKTNYGRFGRLVQSAVFLYYINIRVDIKKKLFCFYLLFIYILIKKKVYELYFLRCQQYFENFLPP